MGAPPPLRDPHTGCLLWLGSKSSSGYGTDWSSGKPRLSHIVAWERVNGAVPSNRQVEHTCRRPLCTFEPHLELVSASENNRRRAWAYRSRITKCRKGHDLWRHGRRTPEGGTVCLVCSGLRSAAAEVKSTSDAK